MSMPVLIATMLLCAFVIDRIIASAMFVASYLKVKQDQTRKGQAKRQQLQQSLVYFCLSGSLALIAMVAIKGLRLDLSAFPNGNIVSPILTWLVLVAGADRISAFAGVGSTPAPQAGSAEQETVEVRVVGTLRVDPETAKKIEQSQAQ